MFVKDYTFEKNERVFILQDDVNKTFKVPYSDRSLQGYYVDIKNLVWVNAPSIDKVIINNFRCKKADQGLWPSERNCCLSPTKGHKRYQSEPIFDNFLEKKEERKKMNQKAWRYLQSCNKHDNKEEQTFSMKKYYPSEKFLYELWEKL